MSSSNSEKDYIKTQSGEGKIERAIHNLQRIEAGLGGLPIRFRNSPEKTKNLRDILNTLKELEERIRTLKGE